MEKEVIKIEAVRKNDGDLSVLISLQGTPEETQKVMTDIVLHVNDCINRAGVVKMQNGFWLCMQEIINEELEKRGHK